MYTIIFLIGMFLNNGVVDVRIIGQYQQMGDCLEQKERSYNLLSPGQNSYKFQCVVTEVNMA